MAEGDNSISAEGRAKAEAELEQRRSVRRPEIVAAIKVAREFGDLKENAEYHAAREEQAHNETRIRVLEHHLASATVRERAGGESIAIGSRVSYRDEATGEAAEVTLVHPLEADLAAGKISVESPVAKALLGNTPGDRVRLETRRGEKRLEILAVA
jgi:transcription elongation factor GreA